MTHSFTVFYIKYLCAHFKQPDKNIQQGLIAEVHDNKTFDPWNKSPTQPVFMPIILSYTYFYCFIHSFSIEVLLSYILYILYYILYIIYYI